MKDLEKGLRYFILIGIFAVLLLTPFLFFDSLFFPYVTGKAIFFRVVATLIFGAWIALASLNKHYLPKFNWVTAIFSGFVVWVFLANILGYFPSDSFWSNFERMEGFLTLLHVFALFLVSTAVMDSKKLWFRLFNFSIAAGFIMGLVALTQYADGASRADGLLGNPIYLAGYMLFHVFLSLYFFLSYIKQNVYLTVVYGGLALFFASIVAVTGTRGAMLGLVTGLFVATLAVAIRKGEKKAIKYTAIAGLLGAFVIGSLFTSVVLVNNYEPLSEASWSDGYMEAVGDLPAVQRFSGISLTEGDALARFLLWDIAIEGIKENPVTGIGQENYIHIFNADYNPELFDREEWFDRAHNIVLEWGLAGGIPAMLAYLALFASAILVLWRAEKLDYYIKAIFSALLIAHLIQNFFVFENMTSYVFFAVFIAFAASMANFEKERETDVAPLFSQNTIKWVVLPIVIVCVSSVVYGVHIKSLQTNLNIIKGMTGVQCGERLRELPWGDMNFQSLRSIRESPCWHFLPEDLKSGSGSGSVGYSSEEVVNNAFSVSSEYFEKAEDASPIGRQEAAEIYSIQAAKVFRSNAGNEVKIDFVNGAQNDLNEYIEEVGDQTRPFVFLGRLYTNIGEYEKAVSAYEDVLATAPNRQRFLIEKGEAHNKLGEYEKAHELFKKAYELEPSFKEPRSYYAASAIYLEDDELFDELTEPFSEEELLFEDILLEPYMEMGEYEEVIEKRKQRIDIVAQELDQEAGGLSRNELERIAGEYNRLIQTYYQAGEIEKAIETAKEIGERFPQLKEDSENIIKQLESAKEADQGE
ncbi:MAG: O-antigen ligase family protein [Candidatus Paceibacterota bacterium]